MSAQSQQNQQTSQQQNSSTQGSSSGNTSVWQPQQQYLLNAFQQAQNALNGNSQYQPGQMGLFSNMLNYGQNNMGTAASSANAGAAASGAAAGGIGAGISGLEGFNPSATNNTANNVANANQYVAGQNIPAQVAADMQNANIEANYVTNPGIDASSAAAGDINSSRNAIEHGLVATNLANTAANTGAQLQANAYNTGLGLSEQQGEANNTANLGALTNLTNGSGYGLNAGTGANNGSVSQAGGLFGISQGWRFWSEH